MVLSLLILAEDIVSSRAVILLDDTRFERGFTVWDPAPGKHVARGILKPDSAEGEPVWGLAQWHSRFSLEGTEAERLSSGAVRFFDGAKAVTFGPDGAVGLMEEAVEPQDVQVAEQVLLAGRASQ